MDRILVTIGGQPVYRKGEAPDPAHVTSYQDARDAAGNPLAATKMSPSGWAGPGSEEAIEAGLPFMGAFAAIILLTIAALILSKRSRETHVLGLSSDAFPSAACSCSYKTVPRA